MTGLQLHVDRVWPRGDLCCSCCYRERDRRGLAGGQGFQDGTHDLGGDGIAANAAGAGDIHANRFSVKVDQDATTLVGSKLGVVLHGGGEEESPLAERRSQATLKTGPTATECIGDAAQTRGDPFLFAMAQNR